MILCLFSECILFYLFTYSGYFYGASSTTQRRSRHSTDTVSEFHTEAPQATASEGLVQGSYAAARAGFELTTFQTKVSNLPMSHHAHNNLAVFCLFFFSIQTPSRSIPPTLNTSHHFHLFRNYLFLLYPFAAISALSQFL